MSLDEKLTSSARLFSLTGNTKWEINYNRHAIVLDSVISKIKEISKETEIQSYIGLTEKANNKLIEIELKSFELAKNNQKRDAYTLLMSDEYSALKEAYKQGFEGISDVVVKNEQNFLENKRTSIRKGNIVVFILILFMLILWIVILRYVFALENKRKEMEVTEIRSREILKNSLEEKEVLLKEIHHRVKNNLQIVSSLLYLQGNREKSNEVSDVIDKCVNRIRSMALIHEKLYQSKSLSRINFEEYCRELIIELHQNYAEDKEISIEFQLDTVYLPIDKCIPLGLILNELITNVFKHAFNEGNIKNPKINVTLSESEANVLLEIADNGKYKAPQSKNNSFGNTLIKSLTKQIRGKVHTKTTNGTKVAVVIPC